MADWAGSIFLVAALSISSYCFYVLPTFPHGRSRLLLAIPLLPVLAALPLLFDPETQPVFVGVSFWVITWLSGFKILNLCFNRGILADPWNLQSFTRFTLALTLPLHLRPSNNKDKSNSGKGHSSFQDRGLGELLFNGLFQGVLFLLVLQVYSFQTLPEMIIEVAYCFSLLTFMSFLCDSAAAITLLLTDVAVEPHFNHPYLSNSFQDFWSRRWNITVNSCFRDTVYKPVLAAFACQGADDRQDASTNRRPSEEAKLCGIFATFFVSGVMHELVILYLTGRVTGEMTAFFLLHACFVSVEAWLRQRGHLKSVPSWMSIPFVVGVTFFSAHLFFFPPLVKPKITWKVIKQVHSWYGVTS